MPKSKASRGLIDKVVEDVRKVYGKGVIARASEASSLHIRRVPTGIFSLDVGTKGGLPCGRVTIVWGPKSAGKSFLALSMCRNVLESDPRSVVYVD